MSEISMFYECENSKNDLDMSEEKIEKTLEERGRRYGSFNRQSSTSQIMKSVMRDTKNWNSISYDKQEALEMIVHKIARILNGDPEFNDSWHDIIGYARLVECNLGKDKKYG